MIVGSFQAHASRQLIEGGVCPTIGCTDLSLPKLIEYEETETDSRARGRARTD